MLDLKPPEADLDYNTDLQPLVDTWTGYYAAADDKHDPAKCDVPDIQLVTARGIEVGHIFYFGTKYSEPLGAFVQGRDGERVALEMGSYGIGVSRLVGAIIEASHDENGIIWPSTVAPYGVGLINLKTGDSACDQVCEELFAFLRTAAIDVLYDDREERAGGKFADMDLIGLPWQIVIGPRGLKNGMTEVRERGTDQQLQLSLEEVRRWATENLT